MENVQNLDCLGRTETVVDYVLTCGELPHTLTELLGWAPALGCDDSGMMVSRIPVTTRNATRSPAWAIQ